MIPRWKQICLLLWAAITGKELSEMTELEKRTDALETEIEKAATSIAERFRE